MWIAQVITCLKHEWLYDLCFPKSSCSMLFHIYHIYSPCVSLPCFFRPLPTSSLDALGQAGRDVLHDCHGIVPHCQLHHCRRHRRLPEGHGTEWLGPCFDAHRILDDNRCGPKIETLLLMAVADCCSMWGKLGKHVACPFIVHC